MFARGFLGVVPTRLIETIVSICRPQEWEAVYVACSGTFRTERGLLSKFPTLEVRSNDVSLFSTALGHAALGKALEYRFKDQLSFIEEFQIVEPVERVAAILMALQYASYARGQDNVFKKSHRQHIRDYFGDYVRDLSQKTLTRFVAAMPITSYFAGDFRDHIEHAIERKAGVIGFPPTFKGGYERMFEFVHKNVDWDPPSYRIYDPAADVRAVLQRLTESGIPFFLYLDQQVEGYEPVVRFEARGARIIYGYGQAAGTSYRAPGARGKPFAYKPIDLTKVTAKSQLHVVPVPESNITFLREVFMKRGIVFGTGDYGVLVFIDDMLVGAVSYRKPMSAGMPLFVLTDLAISREGRLAKLIARVASLRETIRPLETRLIQRFPSMRTTAYSEYPDAMKYRGSWTVEKREETNGKAGRYEINYICNTRDESLRQCFAWWWERAGKQEVAAAHSRAEARRSNGTEAA